MAINRRDSVKVHVAAFGKHPGWDDHIEEIGLDSALLVNAKRVLYTECIGGNIDSGVWEKLEDDKRVPFKHLFYWRTGEGLLIGRMWASKDGKGRAKYPMIVCAQVEGVPTGWAVSQVLPRLAAAEEKCVQTNSAELVRLAIGEARRSLEDAAAGLVAGPPPEETAEALVARIVNAADATPDGRLGLVRILYEMQRELAEFKAGSVSPRTRSRIGDMSGPAAQHLRVPKTLEGPGQAARAWMAVLDQEIAPSVPLLVIEPEGQRFIDIIVGEPRAGQFRCVRCGEKAQGLTSDVPYTMDDATQAQAQSRLDDWAKGRAMPGAPGASDAGPTAGSSKKKLLIAAAALLLLVVIVAFAMKGGGSKGAGGNGGSQTPSQGTKPDQTASSPKPENGKPDSSQTPATSAQSPAEGQSPPGASPKSDAADPRAAWGFDQATRRTRERLDRLNDELKAENAAPNTTAAPKLDDAAERAKILVATPWRPASQQSIARDMASIDAQVADADKEVQAGLDGVATRVAAMLQKRAGEAPLQTDTMKRAFASAVTAIDPAPMNGGGWAGAKAKADALQSAMQDAESAVASVPALEPPPGSMIDAGTLRAAVKGKRDDALQAAAAGAASGDAARVQRAVEQFRDWAAQAKEVVGAASKIESLLASGGEGEAGGSIPDLVAKAQGSPAFREVGPAVLPVFRQADAVKSISGQSSPDALIDAIKGAAMDTGGRRTGEAVAAWGKLPQLGWPATTEDLAKGSELRAGALRNALDQITDAASKARLEGQCAQRATAMWLVFVEHAGNSDASLSAAEGARSAYSVADADLEKLSGRARYNLLRHALVKDVAAANAGANKDQARRAAVTSFLSGVDALGPTIASDPVVTALTSRLRPLLDKSADLDLTRLGPGAAGWKALPPGDDGAAISYSWERAGTTHTLRFQRVAALDDTVSYLGTTEVPVGLFIDAVSAAGKWDDVKPLLANYPAGGDDTRRSGPRVWEWSTNPSQVMIVAAPHAGDSSQGWLRPKTSMIGQEYYPKDVQVSPPTAQHPMQYVSPTAAVLVARILGCRLPTSGEWKAALSAAAPGTPNLRDQTWKREYEHVKKLAGNDPEFPSGGIFRPSDAQKILPRLDGTPAVEDDDGNLWFVPSEPGKPGFQNLVGNVAEFVWEDATTFATTQITAAAVRDALGNGEKLRVIGGSALSPKEENPSEAQVVKFSQAREGYSDVGFRLAFSAPKGAAGAGAGARLDEALAAGGYLNPAK
jgi:hypothetical protein